MLVEFEDGVTIATRDAVFEDLADIARVAANVMRHDILWAFMHPNAPLRPEVPLYSMMARLSTFIQHPNFSILVAERCTSLGKRIVRHSI